MILTPSLSLFLSLSLSLFHSLYVFIDLHLPRTQITTFTIHFRCKGLHGLDAQLLLKLGKTYECHALESAATADTDEHAHKMVAVLEARSALYFKVGIILFAGFLKLIVILRLEIVYNKVCVMS